MAVALHKSDNTWNPNQEPRRRGIEKRKRKRVVHGALVVDQGAFIIMRHRGECHAMGERKIEGGGMCAWGFWGS